MIEIRFIAEVEKVADDTLVRIKATATVDGLTSVTTEPLWNEVVKDERPIDAAARALECLFTETVSTDDFDDLRREYDEHHHGGPS